MLPSRFKTRPNSLLKLSAMSLVVATLSGCGEDAKDCGGFWDKTFGREECVVALPVAAAVPQLPLGANIVQNTFKVATEAQQVFAGQTVEVTSFVDSSASLNGQIKTDAQADIISVMRGEEILLMQPVFDGKPQTAEVSFESTALALVLMAPKFSGSTVDVRKAAVSKIMQHQKFAALVKQVKEAVSSGLYEPMSVMNSASMYDTAGEIADSISLSELLASVNSVSTTQKIAQTAISSMDKVSNLFVQPAYASNTVFNGEQYMEAALQKDKERSTIHQIKFSNKSMVAYFAYNANDTSQSYMVDGAGQAIEFSKFSDIVAAAKQKDGFQATSLAVVRNVVSLSKKSTAIDLNTGIAPSYDPSKSYQINLVGGSNLFIVKDNEDIVDGMLRRFDFGSPEGAANWYNLVNGVGIFAGVLSAAPRELMTTKEIKRFQKFADKLKAVKAGAKDAAMITDILSAQCTATYNALYEVYKVDPERQAKLSKDLCVFLDTANKVTKTLSKVIGVKPADDITKGTWRTKWMSAFYGLATGRKFNEDYTFLKNGVFTEDDTKAIAVLIAKNMTVENELKLANATENAIKSLQFDNGLTLDDAIEKVKLLSVFADSAASDPGKMLYKLTVAGGSMLNDPDIQAAIKDAMTEAGTKAGGWLKKPETQDAIYEKFLVGVQKGAQLAISYQKSSLAFGARTALKKITYGIEIGNKLLPYAYDMLASPPEMSVNLVSGQIQKVQPHIPKMTIRVNGVEKYNLNARQLANNMDEPLEVKIGDKVVISYEANQIGVYSGKGNDLVSEANRSLFVDDIKYPTLVHSFQAYVLDTNKDEIPLRSSALCVRNKTLDIATLVYVDSNVTKQRVPATSCSGKTGDMSNDTAFLNTKNKTYSYDELPIELGGIDSLTNTASHVYYDVERTIQKDDSKLVVSFNNYMATSSDAIVVKLAQHLPATASISVAGVVDYVVTVGEKITATLADIVGEVSRVVWYIIDSSDTEVAKVERAIDEVFEYTFSNEGTYTIKAELQDETKFSVGKDSLTVKAIKADFTDAVLTNTIIPINTPVFIQITGTGLTPDTVFAVENAICNAPLVVPGRASIGRVCTVNKLGKLKVSLQPKAGVDEGGKVFYITAVAEKLVTGTFTVLAQAASEATMYGYDMPGYFAPPVDNESIMYYSTVLAYNGTSRRKMTCTFNTTGQTKTYRNYDLVDANGYSTDILPLLNGFPNMALLAKQGAEPQALLIGKSQTVTIEAGQALNFYVNDDNYGDNEGALTVNYQCSELAVFIKPSTTSPVAQSPITFSFFDTVIQNVKSVIWKVGDVIIQTFTSISDVFSYVFDKAGDYVVSATVKNTNNQTVITPSTSVKVTAAPPVASLVGSAITGVAGQPVTFVLSNSLAKEGKLCSYLFNNGEGLDSGITGCGDDGLPLVFLPITMTYTKAGTFTPTLTVTDSQGKSATTTWLVNVGEAPQIADTGKLNDTGITQCSNQYTVFADCSAASMGGWFGLNQDGETGRDFLAAKGQLTKIGVGDAGFDFTKISATGLPLPASVTEWSCVQDNHTGLMWEVKTDDGGLRDKDNRYKWYNTNTATNGGTVGYENGGNNTQAFAQAVNSQSQPLCGHNNWRLPSKKELHSLFNYGKYNPAIDSAYFPNTVSSYYWSSSPVANGSNYAWLVYFGYGDDHRNGKDDVNYVRLVRSSQ